MCIASCKRPDLSTECLGSSQRQLKACSAAISHKFVIAQVLVPRNDVTGLISMENARLM